MINGRKIVALCTSRVFDAGTHAFIKKLNEGLVNNPDGVKVSLLIFTMNMELYWSDDNLPPGTAVFDFIPYEFIDVLIIMDEKIKSRKITNKIATCAYENHIPLIVIDGYYRSATNIRFDYKEGFRKILEHVLDIHHVQKPFMMAGVPKNKFSDERIEAFKEELEKRDIPFSDDMVAYGHFWSTPTIKETIKLVESGNLPDAIFCANDYMAVNVCDVLAQYNIHVPEDIIVTGFDGVDEAFVLSPKITTASCETFQLAQPTINAIFAALNGKKAPDVNVLPELITNESCGCQQKSLPQKILLNRINSSAYRYQDDMCMLHDTSSKMIMGDTIEDMLSAMNNSIINSLFCVVSKKFFDIEKNYFLEKTPVRLDDLTLIYDTDAVAFFSADFDSFTNIASTALHEHDSASLEKIFKRGYPLIFNALNYMNKPIGYICYYYDNYDIIAYTNTAALTNAISTGIGGFINMKYQESLSDKINEMYKRDALTGLYNRIGFKEVFDREMSKKKNIGKPITIFMSDLDSLKYINDNFGHAEGDNAISVSARALKESCPNTAICARFGGDELFAIIIGDYDVKKIVDNINDKLKRYNETSNLGYSVVVSCGFDTTTLTKDYNMTEELKKADDKMYLIKKEKKKKKL